MPGVAKLEAPLSCLTPLWLWEKKTKKERKVSWKEEESKGVQLSREVPGKRGQHLARSTARDPWITGPRSRPDGEMRSWLLRGRGLLALSHLATNSP